MTAQRGRPKHDDILTPREWEVVELIEAGLTNEEIAERLGISFGTAKYHVAEVISKLGVGTREDAVAAARRVRAPVQPAWALLRGRIGVPAVAVVAVAAAIVLASIAVFTMFLDESSPPGAGDDLSDAAADFVEGDTDAQGGLITEFPEQLSSYYFEARIDAEEDDVLDTLRAWYQAPDRWRFEGGNPGSTRATEGFIQVSDGDTIWFYNVETNTYSRQEASEFFRDIPPELRGTPMFPSMSLLIGPVPGGDADAFLRGLAAGWVLEEQMEGLEIAGRPTDMLRYSVPGSGEVSLWLDREHPFILRFETENPGSPQSYLLVETTEVAFDEPIDRARFRFEPPDSAVELQVSGGSNSGSLSSGGGSAGPGSMDISPPEGFLAPVYLPAGYSVVRTEWASSSADSRLTTSYQLHLEPQSGDAYLAIDQQYRAGGLGAGHREGEPVRIGGVEGYRRTNGEEVSLIWSAGDIVVTVRSAKLACEELLRVAESMQ